MGKKHTMNFLCRAGAIGHLSESSLLHCNQEANVEIYVEILALAYDKYSWEVW